MHGKKLYAVSFDMTCYVLAEDALRAMDVAETAWRDASPTDHVASVSEVRPGEALLDGWEDECLVYHSGREEITLASVRPKVR